MLAGPWPSRSRLRAGKGSTRFTRTPNEPGNMDEGSPYNSLFAVFFDQLYKAVHLVADSNGGRLPRRLAILGDEWGNLPTVRCLPSLLSLGRGYGVSWFGSCQNISQLNKYGERDGRRKVLANCGVKVALKLGEAEDRQYFTELVGKTTRHTQGTSSSRGTSSSSSLSYSEHELCLYNELSKISIPQFTIEHGVEGK